MHFWDWFWYYRRGKVKYRIYDFGDTYMASASNAKRTVWNCYGSTPEAAKEMALWRLNQELELGPVTYEIPMKPLQ